MIKIFLRLILFSTFGINTVNALTPGIYTETYRAEYAPLIRNFSKNKNSAEAGKLLAEIEQKFEQSFQNLNKRISDKKNELRKTRTSSPQYEVLKNDLDALLSDRTFLGQLKDAFNRIK